MQGKLSRGSTYIGPDGCVYIGDDNDKPIPTGEKQEAPVQGKIDYAFWRRHGVMPPEDQDYGQGGL